MGEQAPTTVVTVEKILSFLSHEEILQESRGALQAKLDRGLTYQGMISSNTINRSNDNRLNEVMREEGAEIVHIKNKRHETIGNAVFL